MLLIWSSSSHIRGHFTSCVQFGSVASGGVYTGGEVALGDAPAIPTVILSQDGLGLSCSGLGGGCDDEDGGVVAWGDRVGDWSAHNVVPPDNIWVWTWVIFKITVLSGSFPNGNPGITVRSLGTWEGGAIKIMASNLLNPAATPSLTVDTIGRAFGSDKVIYIEGGGGFTYQTGYFAVMTGPGAFRPGEDPLFLPYAIGLELVDVHWNYTVDGTPTKTKLWDARSRIFVSGVRLT